MWDVVTDGIDKLNLHGIFNVYNNKSGCVRDHKVSKTDGFIAGVFPEILRHPANCQILTHAENASKGKKSNITINELFELIKSYKGEWNEHIKVLQLIRLYKDGHRANMDDYRGR